MSQVKHRVLFVCIHNSARSQMAEAFLKQLGGSNFEVESAGIEKGNLNPNVVTVMAEIGIDISNNKTKEVFDLFQQGKFYQAVITVCDAASAEQCPIFPGMVKRIAWSFADPSRFSGTQEEILQQIRTVRDEIKAKIQEFITEASNLTFWMRTETV
jgi:arsenate reductase